MAVIGAGGSLTATGSEFSHNFAESYGGAINLIAGAVAHLSDGCTVHKNQANHQGGAVSMRDGTALTLARGVVMSENFAAVAYRVFLPTNGGGAIYARAGADIVMEGKVSFVGNFAGSLGGAVCGFRGATITVAEGAEVEIRENEAMMIGAGLLCWEACDFSNSGQMDIVANKNLEVARAQWGGAGMAFSGVSGGQVDIGGSVSVLDNTNAGGGGAGLYFFQATARISGVLLLRGNLAKYGGGLAAVSGSTVEVTGEVDVEDNEALGDGGGVYVTVSALNATGLRVRRNTAAADGGGIAVLDGTVHVWGGQIGRAHV